MADELFNTGEEYVIDHLDGDTVDVGLYSNATDALSDSEDVSDITTEPTGSAYARQSATLSTEKNANSNWSALVSDVTFDTSDSSRSVDSGFVVVEFDSDDTGDSGTVNPHLLFAFRIKDSNGNDTTLDLSNFNTVTLTGQSLSLD
jgi:hypothetical protein